MKNSLSKILIIFALAIFLTFTLSACSLIEGFFITSGPTAKVTSVEFSTNGLSKIGSKYEAEAGVQFTISAKLNEDAPKNVKYEWYLIVNGKTSLIGGATTSVLKYTFDKYSSDEYTFYVKADDFKSGNVVVTLKYAAKIDNARISSTTHEMVNDVIQQKSTEIAEIRLKAEWNESALPIDSLVTFEWKIAGVSVATTREFAFTPEDVGIVKIDLVLTCDGKTASASVTVVVLQYFDVVEDVKVTFVSGGTAFGEGNMVQYLQIVSAAERSPITLSAVAYPVATVDSTAKVVWTVADKDGTRVLDETSRTVTFTPAYGETHVTACIDNVKSKKISFFALNEYDYNTDKEYIEKTYIWADGVENYQISSQKDLNTFVCYMASTRKTAEYTSGGEFDKPENVFNIGTSDNFDFINFTSSERNRVLNESMSDYDEAGRLSVGMYGYSLYLSTESEFSTPTQHFTPAANVQQSDGMVLISRELTAAEKRTSLPVDDFDVYPSAVNNSEMLYRVVGWGYKPTFDSDATGNALKPLFDRAYNVLMDYISDDMNDVTKVRVIYEWISQNVDYDYALLAYNGNKLCYNAFSLEGVFADADGEGNGQAVCDGRAKAFVLLCGMEGIKSVRIEGQANVGGSSEGHAWNKVLIDADGNGVKEWYFIDTTWSDRGNATAGVYKEVFNMQYFLRLDSDVTLTHIPDAKSYNPPTPTVDDDAFDCYADTVIGEGATAFSTYVVDSNQLRNAALYSLENEVYVEIKVARNALNATNPIFNNETMIYAIKKVIGTSYPGVRISTIQLSVNENIFLISLSR